MWSGRNLLFQRDVMPLSPWSKIKLKKEAASTIFFSVNHFFNIRDKNELRSFRDASILNSDNKIHQIILSN
jgi:hypothetical protein